MADRLISAQWTNADNLDTGTTADLISRSALQKLFNDVSSGLLSYAELSKDAEHIVRACLMITEMINDAPMVDAVEVVRCRDCVHQRRSTIFDGQMYCSRIDSDYSGLGEDDDYCSYGRRRESATD